MRVLVTADLHYNQARSRTLAEELIARMCRSGGDVLLLVGDTATAEGDWLEECLSRFTFGGEKLFVAGNHELWTNSSDSYALFKEELPRRVRQMGWRWLETEPFVHGEIAIVGSVGWYDYSFAPAHLAIPLRFYQNKISPGAAVRLAELAHLFEDSDDIPEAAKDISARWNDGRFVKLHRGDGEFLDELLANLRNQLRRVSVAKTILAGVHHLPFRELLPPPDTAQWDFAKAFLGSGRIGEVLVEFPAVKHVFCGHSHLPGEAQVGPIHAVNVGSGYRWKTFHSLDVA